MGVLRDLFEILHKDLSKDFDPFDTKNNKRQFSSISKRAAEGTLQFPAIVSRTIPYSTTQKIVRAVEANAASFAQIVFTMSPQHDINSDGVDYIRQFHQNMDTETNIDDVIGDGIKAFGENYIATRMYQCNDSTFRVIKEELSEHGIDFREGTLNNIVCNESIKDATIVKPISVAEALAIVQEKTNRPKPAGSGSRNNPPPRGNNNNVSVYLDKTVTNVGDGKQKPEDTTIVPKNILMDNDIRKTNDLVPTLLHIRVLATDQSGKTDVAKYIDFVVGIKATIHPVNSQEMIDNIVDACNNHDGFFKFIKWTTGEISFFKDFLLNMGESQKDVIDRSKGSSGFWIALKRRRVLAKAKANMFMKNRILPNASIVISQSEVDYIKSVHGFDLMNSDLITKIMDKFFLLSFIIVDDALEIVHIKYDGQISYQTLSFNGLEKENSNSARNFKDILKAVQRI